MNTLEKLERSVHALIEAHDSLRSDNEKNTGGKANSFRELDAAGKKIKELHTRIEELEKGQLRVKDLEKKKGLIKKQINIILEKIDSN